MRQKHLVAAIILASIFLGASMLTRGHEWGDDFASYIMQAQSIWDGKTQQFVEHNSFTILESSNLIGPVAYPWGYPLILSPVYALKGIHPLALKLPGLFFYGGFLVCLYGLVRNRLTQAESLLVVSLFAFNPLLLDFLDQILSDIPLLFFSTVALLLMTGNRRRSTFELITLGFAIASAFFIRATGILLLGSFLIVGVVTAWFQRSDHETLKKYARDVFTVVSTFGLLWILYALIFPGGGESYFSQYREFKFATAVGFINGYFQLFHSFFGENIIWNILNYVFFIFFLIGAWKSRREDPIFIVFFLIWMLLLITWPFWQGPRFIFPLLPIFIYFIFQGMKFILESLPDKYKQIGVWIFYGFWSLIVIIFLFISSTKAYVNVTTGRSINGPFDPYSKEVYSYIQGKTPADSIIIFFKPRAMRLMTGHDTFMSTDCDRMLKGDYLVLSKKVGNNQQIPPEEIGSCSLTLQDVLENNRFIVYRIQK
jgi:4-amino-4-deoxy-L-arabinose transferase-like glycosyltransferase